MQVSAQGIFTCVDAKGRRLTADRPIPECTDREQKELNPTGTVKRKIGPVLTADERAAEEEKNRKALEERNRLAEEKKRDRALLIRYPDQRAHDKERVGALAVADDAIVLAKKNVEDLAKQRRKLETELEFYQNNPSKVPGMLKRQVEENNEHTEAQKRFIANQDKEKLRINARFDDELVKLKQLWAQRGTPPTAVGAASAPAKR
ncbi:DUF4124 domain-containing protein [Ramlibacter sp. WS9]|nr:DUF4124 domain-containing protein [Ramlibacter sp. WS9]